MELTDCIKVTDKHGFVYHVNIKHVPPYGYSLAYYEGSIIAECSFGRMLAPQGDDDGEWEAYQERFMEWAGDRVTDDLRHYCVEYFNKLN